MAIKTELEDPYNVLDNWDINSVDPCSWRMVTCSSDGYVSALYVSSLVHARSEEHQQLLLSVGLLTCAPSFAEDCLARACPASYHPASATSPGCNLCKFTRPPIVYP